MNKDFIFSEDVALNDLEMQVLEDRRSKTILGERRLLLAMLSRAKEDLQSEDEKIRIEAEEWLYNEEEPNNKTPDHLSFKLICYFLNLDPSLTRREIFKSIKKLY